MADDKMNMKKWMAVHNEFARKINNDFMKSPKTTLDLLQPAKYRAFEKVLRAYLKDCGVQEFLGECDTVQFKMYTKGLFSGRKDLGMITDVIYGHWNNMPKDIIKQSYFLSSTDGRTAYGFAVKLTDDKGGFYHLILGPNKNDTWEISQKDINELKKKALNAFTEEDLIACMLAQFLLPGCPSNIGAIKFEKVY